MINQDFCRDRCMDDVIMRTLIGKRHFVRSTFSWWRFLTYFRHIFTQNYHSGHWFLSSFPFQSLGLNNPAKDLSTMGQQQTWIARVNFNCLISLCLSDDIRIQFSKYHNQAILSSTTFAAELAEPLWIDPGLKSGLSVRDLTSTYNKAQAGLNCRTFSRERGKSHHRHMCSIQKPHDVKVVPDGQTDGQPDIAKLRRQMWFRVIIWKKKKHYIGS